jgi:tetratricopeptide (TPR) repeat protein
MSVATNAPTALSPEVKVFSSRAPLVGRAAELERLDRYLHARGERHFVYYLADGGLGKTRLLEELEQKVKAAGPKFSFSGIMDLYHTDTHSNSDVEHTIVQGLDPAEHYFPRYRAERTQYIRIRERGADPGELERRRQQLSGMFVEECNRMALEAHKLVLCFDTIELLQYESSIVEERARLDEVDARLKPWLLKTLPQLHNVLVVFAGRPRQPASDEASASLHVRLLKDMETAFRREDSHWEAIELKPFTQAETDEFIHSLSGSRELIPAGVLPLVHRLTEGRPIFLHLILDLIGRLSQEPGRILALFDQWADLAQSNEGDAQLQGARHEVQEAILASLQNDAGDLSGYFARLALMPKGIDADVLQEVFGMTLLEAQKFLDRIRPLSFVKQHKGRLGAQLERFFLHDEMYRLLTSPTLISYVRVEERAMAARLATSYYVHRITEMTEQQQQQQDPAARAGLRRQLQQLQVEQLYYLLAQDVHAGYDKFRKLSDQAHRDRQVGFSMQLLDEFLRFYNTPARRRLFAMAEIEPEQVTRENALLWLERFHWWASYERAVAFAETLMADPVGFHIRDEDLASWGNLYAFWVRDRTILYGYEPATIEKARPALDALRLCRSPGRAELLARARLATSIGYMLDQGGLLDSAAPCYVEAKTAFSSLNGYRDELAMLLNNMAYLYATQGQMTLARSLASEALRINRELNNIYSRGLTLATLANVEIRRGDYRQAADYGKEALGLFQELEDAHGTVLALLSCAQADRKQAKYKLLKEGKLEEAHTNLLGAASVSLPTGVLPSAGAALFLERALETAARAGLENELPRLHVKLGKVYRDAGVLLEQLQEPDMAKNYYGKSEAEFRQALDLPGLNKLDRADAIVDFAEGLFVAGRIDAANQRLQEFRLELGRYYVEPLNPKESQKPLDQPENELPSQYYRPLAKAERLRGQMAMKRDDTSQALIHYATAYDYFVRFSSVASELEDMVEMVYTQLNNLPPEKRQQQQRHMKGLYDWVNQLPASYRKLRKFVDTLCTLLGVEACAEDLQTANLL